MSDILLNYDIAVDDVDKFKHTGEFINNIDGFGNVQQIFSIAQSTVGNLNYVKIPLKTLTYNESKILDSNEVEFTELQTTTREAKQNVNEILQQYNSLLAENRILNETVNNLVEKYEKSDDKQVIEALKNTIISLRIQLGQGSTPSDFGDDFPFLPLI